MSSLLLKPTLKIFFIHNYLKRQCENTVFFYGVLKKLLAACRTAAIEKGEWIYFDNEAVKIRFFVLPVRIFRCCVQFFMNRKSLLNQLKLAYAPLTAYEFAVVKDDKLIDRALEKASLYLIAQRAVITFENVIPDTTVY
jgi:hypothetical protein